MKSQPPIGIGVVGLGGMGQLHASSMRELGAEIVAGVDLLAEQRSRFEREFDATTYESHDELVTNEDVDAVVVTTPNKFHEPAAVAALEADRHVLVEKPLAHTLESAERIAAAAADSAGHCLVGFHNRHTASTALFDAYNARGHFGTVTHVEANYLRRRGVPGRNTWFTNSELAGGGSLIDIGVHVLDLALYLLDFPPIVEVSGIARTTFGHAETYADPDGFARHWDDDDGTYDVDDAVSAFIRCANGKSIALEVAWAANRKPCSEMVVRGTDAGAQFELGGTDVTLLEASIDGIDHYADTELTGDTSVTGYKEQDEYFLETVAADDEPTMNTVEQALQVQRVIDAIYRSSEEQRAISLTDRQELSPHAE